VGGPSDRLFHDHNAAVAEYTRDGGCALSSDGPRFRIAQLIDAAASQAATDSFGADGDLWTRGAIVPEAVAAHAARGIRIRSDGMLEIDYAWMVKNSIKTLKPVADRLNELCKEAGLQSPRARVGMYASFVQSLQYSLGREGSRTDGRMAFGVQMPATTLHDGMGDCDSLALLFVSLLRAGGVCQSGLVLIGPTLAERNALDAQAVGHAMAAVEVDIQAAALDDVIEFSRGGEMRKALLVELTCPCAIGVADRRYQGRSVTVTAWGMT
jgi:hypothetical protein